MEIYQNIVVQFESHNSSSLPKVGGGGGRGWRIRLNLETAYIRK